jgi:DNA-binding IclR family transcriptional regulator
MTPTDDLILQTLADSELVLSPAVIAYNLEISREHVNRRLTAFVERELVSRPDRGYYEISELGQAYLAGEVDPDDIN